MCEWQDAKKLILEHGFPIATMLGVGGVCLLLVHNAWGMGIAGLGAGLLGYQQSQKYSAVANMEWWVRSLHALGIAGILMVVANIIELSADHCLCSKHICLQAAAVFWILAFVGWIYSAGTAALHIILEHRQPGK